MAKPKFLQWFAYDVRTVATDCSGMSGDQEATYHRLMRYLWDEGPQSEAVLRGRSFGNWDAISHCFTAHGDGLSLAWMEAYRVKANEVSERQRTNRGSTMVAPRLHHGYTADAPSREEEEEEEEERKKKKQSVAGKPPKREIEWLRSECRKVVESHPAVLTESERKPFFDYWTEPSASGLLRFQREKFFDVKRRMETWQRNSEARGPRSEHKAPQASTTWNPRA